MRPGQSRLDVEIEMHEATQRELQKVTAYAVKSDGLLAEALQALTNGPMSKRVYNTPKLIDMIRRHLDAALSKNTSSPNPAGDTPYRSDAESGKQTDERVKGPQSTGGGQPCSSMADPDAVAEYWRGPLVAAPGSTLTFNATAAATAAGPGNYGIVRESPLGVGNPLAFQEFCERVWDTDESDPILAVKSRELKRIFDCAQAALAGNSQVNSERAVLVCRDRDARCPTPDECATGCTYKGAPV